MKTTDSSLSIRSIRAGSAVCAALFSSIVAVAPSTAATLPTGFSEARVVTGLSNPTAMTLAPDGRIFVCEQGGALRIVKNGALLGPAFATLAVDSSGERGLLGVALDPSFTVNQYVYVYYTATTSPRHNRISRLTANGDVAVVGSEVPLLELNNLSSATNHNGGALHFGPDGKLYASVGENANGQNAQTLNNLLGKVLRMNPTPGDIVPTDNPFFGTATGNNRLIWAMGLRNPFTFAFQPNTGRMFINDVGAGAWEEINDGIAGSNYGWPGTEGPTTNPSFRSPLYAYQHNSGTPTGCAITGGTFYNPAVATFPASYVGQYFFSDLCGGFIWRFNPSGGAAPFATGISSPVDMFVSPQGDLHYLQRGNGSIWRIYWVAQRVNVDDRQVLAGAASTAAFRVWLDGTSNETVTVDYATSNGSATAGPHYTSTNGTLTFTPGRRFHAVIVPITATSLSSDRTFTLTLSNPTRVTLGDGTATGTIGPDPTTAMVPMYRTYNRFATYHFFTTSLAERDNVVATGGYTPEGTAFRCANTRITGSVPLFRLYNPNNGRHYYTPNAGERDTLMGNSGLVFELEQCFIAPTNWTGTVEAFRMYNRLSGAHLYTISTGERDALLTNFPGIWEQHGSLGWVLAP